MKTLSIFFFLSLFLLNSCSVLKEYSTEGFTIVDNTVSFNNVPMAELVGLEFALDNKKLVKELTFKVLGSSDNTKINNLIAYLHQEHPDYEIEIEIPFEHIEHFRKQP